MRRRPKTAKVEASALRIVGGELGGRRLKVPAGARPTSERVREALASALAARHAIEGCAVLDLFAGSGALGLEMLSRGAASLVAVEGDRKRCRAITDSTRELGVADRVAVLCEDLVGRRKRALERIARTAPAGFDLVLADPPYALARELTPLIGALCEARLLQPQAWIAVEHPHDGAPEPPAHCVVEASYRHGDTGLSLWRWVAARDES